MKKIYLIDGMSMVFRAFHAMFKSGLTRPDGEPSGAVYGFSNIITKLIETENPDHLAVVFDTSAPTFRHDMFDAYKANRSEFPEDLIPQMPRIKNLITLLGIPQVELDGYEADDIIATLAKQASHKSINAICVTSDKDFMQLVDDNVKLLKPSRKGEGMEWVSYDEVKEKFGVRPDQVIDIQALIGDAVDNIPGVKGVGPKTAAPLIVKYENLEGLYEHIDEIDKKGLKLKLENDKEMAFISKELVTLKLDVPVDFTLEDCKLNEPKFAGLDDFFKDMGFRAQRKKWHDKSVEAGIAGSLDNFDESGDNIVEESSFDDINTTKHDYRFINTVKKLEFLCKELEDVNELSFDLETSSLDIHNCDIVGVALSWKEFQGVYIPTIGKNSEGREAQADMFAVVKDTSNYLDINLVLNKLRPFLESQNIEKFGQNAKFDTIILKRHNVTVSPVTFDSMLAQYLLDPDQPQGMDALAEKYLNYKPVSITSLIGEKKKDQKSMADLDPVSISDYACEDADVTLRLKNILAPKLEEAGISDLARDLEFPMIEILTKVESNGVALDSKALAALEVEITTEVERLKLKIYEEAGIEFNIDSPKQLGHILFEKLMIPVVKKTKTGFSTDVGVLTELAETYEIAEHLLSYRSLAKLNSTYVKALPKLVNKNTGRIHTTYNQSVAATGRLSSVNPNLQNIPIKTDLGKQVRKAFIPSKGNVILAADYSQIELRIMAHVAGDDSLVQAFKNGIDIHSATASKVFGKDLEHVTSDDRRVAKSVNFGIMYGLGAFGLSKGLGITRKYAAEVIEQYFESYPGIRSYIDDTIAFTRNNGFAETMCKRRRFFPEINATNRMVRTGAERAAINMPIQGTASDMMKIAMIAIQGEIDSRNLQSKMIMQVHDELVFDTLPSELDELKEMVINCMESALELGEVPVVVDAGVGSNWHEAHE